MADAYESHSRFTSQSNTVLESIQSASKRHEDFADAIASLFEEYDEAIAKDLERWKGIINQLEEYMLSQNQKCRIAFMKGANESESRCHIMQQVKVKPLKGHYKKPDFLSPPAQYAQIKSQLYALAYLDLPNYRVPRAFRVRFPDSITIASMNELHSVGVSHLLHHPMRDPTTINKPVFSVGSKGKGPLQFQYPLGITMNPITSEIYVAECDNTRIQILTPDLEHVKFLGSKGTMPSQFQEPRSVAISPNGRIAVVDNCNNRIQIFDQNHEFLSEVLGKFEDCERFRDPRNIAVDNTGNFYISDRNNERILKIDEDGNVICSIGNKKSEAPIGLAYGIAVTTCNELIAITHGGDVVRVYDLSGTHLRDIKVFKTSGSWPSNYLGIGPDGGFVLVCVGSGAIHFYSRDGNLIHNIKGSRPVGVVFGVDDRFYVIENGHGRIDCY
eukprot:TRINITY_DN8286_c0_g1_i1.p1 TRINITY_DN8286_c0_g1~~TRINITY_DN8286_c0_g1_i1.p1  ORF type:complete len:443 (+),score=91.95 TRINITY_DN8286_c0_g1_i1:58-1386(+)